MLGDEDFLLLIPDSKFATQPAIVRYVVYHPYPDLGTIIHNSFVDQCVVAPTIIFDSVHIKEFRGGGGGGAKGLGGG